MKHRIDVTTPSPARVYDYLLGGRDNFAVDRAAAEQVLAHWPDIAVNARVNRSWMRRVVRMLAEAGVDQFLDVGSGLPTADNVHQVAQRVDPDARVLYVDHDPIVLTHGRALLAEDRRTEYVEADAADAAAILDRAAAFLDPARPVAILMASVLHYLPQAPADVVAPYLEWAPPGSHLAVSHVASDGVEPAMLESLATHFADMIPRPAAEIEAALKGADLLAPGIVEARRWRPEDDVPLGPLPLLAGVGRVR